MTTRKLSQAEIDGLYERMTAIQDEIADMTPAKDGTAWHLDRVAELKRIARLIYG